MPSMQNKIEKNKDKNFFHRLSDYIKTIRSSNSTVCSENQYTIRPSVIRIATPSTLFWNSELNSQVNNFRRAKIFYNTSASAADIGNNNTIKTVRHFLLEHKKSAQESLFYSFLLSIPEEVITQCLKNWDVRGHKFADKEIFWINQIFKAFALFKLLGSFPYQIFGLTLAKFLLNEILAKTHSDPKKVNNITTALTLIGMATYFGPTAFLIGLGTGLIGTLTGKAVVNNGLFAIKQSFYTLSNAAAKYIPCDTGSFLKL